MPLSFDLQQGITCSLDGLDHREQHRAFPWEAPMFDQAVQFSEASRQAAGQMPGLLIPALQGCPYCRTVQMISAPALGTCNDCGAEMRVLDPKDACPSDCERHVADSKETDSYAQCGPMRFRIQNKRAELARPSCTPTLAIEPTG
jgi:hypothetical protein